MNYNFPTLVRVIAIASIVLLSSLSATAQSRSPRVVLNATAQSSALGALVPNPVQIPSSMRSAPFDVERTLNLPPGFKIAVYARIPGARFMAIAPNGDLLVSQPSMGKVIIVRPNAGGEP